MNRSSPPDDASEKWYMRRPHNDCCQRDGGGFNWFGRRKSTRTSALLMRSHGEMVSAVANTSEANTMLLKRVTEAETRSRQLEAKFSSMEDEISRKQEMYTSMKSKLDSVTQEKYLLEKEVGIIRRDRDERLQQNKLLKQDLQELQRSTCAGSSKLCDLQDSLQRTEKELSQANDNVIRLNSDRNTLDTAMKSLQKDLDSAVKRESALSEKLNLEEAYRSKVDVESANLRTALAGLRQEKNDLERDAQCNMNYLQRELHKLSERLKRRHRLVDKLVEDKEDLLAALREKSGVHEQRINICRHEWNDEKQNNQEVMKSLKSIPEYWNSQTKILELELKVARREDLIRTLEDRVRNHEPGFCVQADPETNLYVDDLRMKKMSHNSYSKKEKMPQTSYLDDSGCGMDITNEIAEDSEESVVDLNTQVYEM